MKLFAVLEAEAVLAVVNAEAREEGDAVLLAVLGEDAIAPEIREFAGGVGVVASGVEVVLPRGRDSAEVDAEERRLDARAASRGGLEEPRGD